MPAFSFSLKACPAYLISKVCSSLNPEYSGPGTDYMFRGLIAAAVIVSAGLSVCSVPSLLTVLPVLPVLPVLSVLSVFT